MPFRHDANGNFFRAAPREIPIADAQGYPPGPVFAWPYHDVRRVEQLMRAGTRFIDAITTVARERARLSGEAQGRQPAAINVVAHP
jgi:hypothetical protein